MIGHMRYKQYGLDRKEESICSKLVDMLSQFEPKMVESIVADLMQDAKDLRRAILSGQVITGGDTSSKK